MERGAREGVMQGCKEDGRAEQKVSPLDVNGLGDRGP